MKIEIDLTGTREMFPESLAHPVQHVDLLVQKAQYMHERTQYFQMSHASSSLVQFTHPFPVAGTRVRRSERVGQHAGQK